MYERDFKPGERIFTQGDEGEEYSWLHGCTLLRKLLLLDSLVRSIAEYRWASWPFIKSVAVRLDILHSYCFRISCGLIYKPGESFEIHLLPKTLMCGKVTARWGKCSFYYAPALNGVLSTD